MNNILHITNELNTVDGVTGHLYVLLRTLKGLYKGRIFILAGGGNNTALFKDTDVSVGINPLLNHKNRSLRNFTSAISFVRKFVRENNIDLIHSHNHYAANIAHYAARFTGIVTVQTNHGLFEDKGRLGLFKADYHIALNSRVYSRIREKGISAERALLIKPGIDHSPLNIRKGHDTFLAASRFSKEKGLDVYVSASNNLEQKYPGRFRFILTGEGDEELNLKNLNDELGGAVDFVKDYKQTLSKASVFVFPTLASEGLPVVLLESVFSGCLVISSAYDGVNDIFPPPFDELLVKPGDVKDLKRKMIYASENAEMLFLKYKKRFEAIRNEYSAEKMTEKHIALYEKIMRRT